MDLVCVCVCMCVCVCAAVTDLCASAEAIGSRRSADHTPSSGQHWWREPEREREREEEDGVR